MIDRRDPYIDIPVEGLTLPQVRDRILAAFAMGYSFSDMRLLAGDLAEPAEVPMEIAGEKCVVMIRHIAPGAKVHGVLAV